MTPGEKDMEDIEDITPDSLPLVTYIQLARIYDVLIVILAEQNPVKAQELVDLHESGDFIGPDPAVAAPDAEETGEEE